MTNLVKAEPQSLAVTFQDVKKYLCPQATDQETFMFLQLCKSQNLNPWRREVYLIKYGNQAASIVVGKDLFTRRAQANPRFQGFKAGIIVGRSEQVLEIEGAFRLKTDTLLGGWAEVFLKDYTSPIKSTVSMEEYGKGQSSWNKIPATMIRKVALVQALREAFPDELGGLYDAAEMGVEPTALPASEIKPESTTEPTVIEKGTKTIIDDFLEVNADLSELAGPDTYKKFIVNSKGQSPEVDQIKTWKSPKQLAWLRTAVGAMRDEHARLEAQMLSASKDELPDFDESEAVNG